MIHKGISTRVSTEYYNGNHVVRVETDQETIIHAEEMEELAWVYERYGGTIWFAQGENTREEKVTRETCLNFVHAGFMKDSADRSDGSVTFTVTPLGEKLLKS